MKFIFPLCFIAMLSFRATAQDAVAKPVVTLSGKEQPEFPGGEKELRKYLQLNLRYPNQALEKQVGGELEVSFVINEAGSISDIKIEKGLGYGCDEEAVRVVGLMPSWHPAQIEGKPVKVTYTLPVVFELPSLKTAGKD